MKYWQALIELESGGYDDIPDEHILTLLEKTVKELQERGYEISCEEYRVIDTPNYSQKSKSIVFDGKA